MPSPRPTDGTPRPRHVGVRKESGKARFEQVAVLCSIAEMQAVAIMTSELDFFLPKHLRTHSLETGTTFEYKAMLHVPLVESIGSTCQTVLTGNRTMFAVI